MCGHEVTHFLAIAVEVPFSVHRHRISRHHCTANQTWNSKPDTRYSRSIIIAPTRIKKLVSIMRSIC